MLSLHYAEMLSINCHISQVVWSAELYTERGSNGLKSSNLTSRNIMDIHDAWWDQSALARGARFMIKMEGSF